MISPAPAAVAADGCATSAAVQPVLLHNCPSAHVTTVPLSEELLLYRTHTRVTVPLSEALMLYRTHTCVTVHLSEALMLYRTHTCVTVPLSEALLLLYCPRCGS